MEKDIETKELDGWFKVVFYLSSVWSELDLCLGMDVSSFSSLGLCCLTVVMSPIYQACFHIPTLLLITQLQGATMQEMVRTET